VAERSDCCDRRPLAPPWVKTHCWRQINGRLEYWIDRRRGRLKKALEAAQEAAGVFQGLFAEMDALCAGSCRFCPDPCCRSARPWFDFTDLLFLHLLDESIPPRQIRSTPRQACHYLEFHGCRLARLKRPFICTWYLCPTQRLRAGRRRLARLTADIHAVKTLRRRMEQGFIRAVR